MKILLIAVNAKYIHSNLAVYCLKAFAEKNNQTKAQIIEIAEYSINQQPREILMDIYKRKPDFLAFSCYIWNIEMIREISNNLKKILPQVPIWAGGPEVSYDTKEFLNNNKQFTGIIKGEGELSFASLLSAYGQIKDVSEIKAAEEFFKKVKGICYRSSEGKIIENEEQVTLNLSLVPFPYEDINLFHNKIIYYESSRGCPFSCSYCLSSVDKRVRFRNLDMVKEELMFFLKHKVPQVKFVDRTFNCHHEHALAIWSFIRDNDNGITNFHFEISADLLTGEELELLQSLRPGLAQLEIGVQSTNVRTIEEIDRRTDLVKLKRNVREIGKGNNIHEHLDLIAGLPFEDYTSFRQSFNEIYELRPNQLQLGFLKVLKGSKMHIKAEEYGIRYQHKPPYEILFSKWMPFSDMIKLKEVEEIVEVYYNSGQFVNTLALLASEYEAPFLMYERLAAFYSGKEYFTRKHTRIDRYYILLEFIKEEPSEKPADKMELYRQMLVYDLYLRENLKSRPDFAGDLTEFKNLVREFYKKEEEAHIYLKGYEKYSAKQMMKMTHLEIFRFPVYDLKACFQGKAGRYPVLFDYGARNAYTHDAGVIVPK